jgi:hypothetical protein
VTKTISSYLNLLAILAPLALGVLLNGCAAASAVSTVSAVGGSLNSSALEIHNNTDVRLQDRNFIVVRTNVMGQSKGFALLGLLTIDPAKFTTAMSRLYDHADLKLQRPQTLVNLVMEKDSSFYILFSIPRTSIRADVIEFTSVPATNSVPP